MEPLIRSVQLEPARTRLSDVGAIPVRSSSAGLREEIEAELRAEFALRVKQQYDAAHALGLADGRAAAIEAARADAAEKLSDLSARVQDALTALGQAHHAALSRVESDVGEVAFAVVCQLVGEQAASRLFVMSLVERTCAQLRSETHAAVRMHPRDIELLAGGSLRVESLGLQLVPDESLALGGCVVESTSGQYDGSLENQLRRLHSILTTQPRKGV